VGRPVVVFDTATPQFQRNQVFNYEYASRFPGAAVWALLHGEVTKRGWDMVTSDVFVQCSRLEPAVCISEMVTPYTRAVLRAGAIPAVIVSGESPNVAWRFYSRLSRHVAPYAHAFLFRGAEAWVKPPTRFHPVYWANSRSAVFPGIPWEKRRLLVMVAGNKQRIAPPGGGPTARARWLAKRLLWRYLRLANPIFRFEDLYTKRLEAIRYFAGKEDFQLYGVGWDRPGGVGRPYLEAARLAGARPVYDKVKAMSGFKFAVAFENCTFPGYVTEKIFDCFFAGCIPIYYGAPDISDFVPQEAFIDFRRFTGFEDLQRYLRDISPAETKRYRDSASAFLESPGFNRFRESVFVHELLCLVGHTGSLCDVSTLPADGQSRAL